MALSAETIDLLQKSLTPHPACGATGVYTSRITPLNPPLLRGETRNLVPSPL